MSPRDKFRYNKTLTRGYNDLIHGFQLQSAMDAAAREQDLSMALTDDLTAAAANRWRKEGADMFRRILEQLNADSPAPSAPIIGNLTYSS